MSDMDTRTFTLDVDGADMAVYEAAPDGPPRGALIVIQEAFGVNHHIEDVTRRAAAAGYLAVAPHLYHRSGSPVIAYDDIPEVIPHMVALTDEGMLADLRAVVDHLHQAGFADSQIGIVGFCMGGRASFLAAGSLALGAAVGFYGGGIVNGRTEGMPSLLPLIPALATPWLGLFGDADPGIPSEEVEQLRAELAAAPAETEIVRYPGAEHGFHCDARSSYDAASAVDAWARTLAWMDAHLHA